MSDKTFLIRFDNSSKILTNILNDFVFRCFPHNVTFRPSTWEILQVVIEFWKDSNIHSNEIDWILDNWNKNPNSVEFWDAYLLKYKNDIRFKEGISFLTNTSSQAQISMKCFTEVRDNQKLDPFTVGFFGRYGIAMKKTWALKANAAAVMYVDKNSFFATAMGRMFSIYQSTAHSGKNRNFSMHAMRAFFDVWSFFEVFENYHEYEWRILGKSSITGDPSGFEKRTDDIKFSWEDIIALYVPEKEIEIFEKVLRDKAQSEKFNGMLPEIKCVDEIMMTDAESKTIRSIRHRK